MKTILVVVRARAAERVAEALRAAVGLTLRGDRVRVALLAEPPRDERIQRALATLRALGHDVEAGAEAVRGADAVEVWT